MHMFEIDTSINQKLESGTQVSKLKGSRNFTNDIVHLKYCTVTQRVRESSLKHHVVVSLQMWPIWDISLHKVVTCQLTND